MYMRMDRVALIVGVLTAPAWGQTAGMLSFQGLIKDSNGVPVTTPVNLEFRVYDTQDLGTGTVTAGPFFRNGVQPANGLVSTKFGPVDPSVFNGCNPSTPCRWLEVSVDGTPLSRMEMVTAPATAEQVNIPGSGTAAIHVASDGKIGIGTSSPLTPLHVSSDGGNMLTLETTQPSPLTGIGLAFSGIGDIKKLISLRAITIFKFSRAPALTILQPTGYS